MTDKSILKYNNMERVLSCVDILHLIFGDADMDKKSLARNARVCQTWFEPAIRQLWSSLDNVHHLFATFHPGRFSDSIDPVHVARADIDWSRFNVYAKHVRILKVIIHEDYNRDVHDILSRLAYTRPIKSLVPNIIELEIICDINILNSLFFIHDNLRKLSIEFSEESPEIHFYDIFYSILPRTPNLVHFYLHRSNESGPLKNGELPFQREFISATRQLVYLEIFSTFGFNYTSDMILCLALLPNLKEVAYFASDLVSDFELEERHGEPVASITDLQPFPRLNEFVIFSNLVSLAHFLSMKISLPKIKYLDISVEGEATQVGTRKCFERLAADWRTLTTLSLSFKISAGENSPHPNLFQPLSNLRHMEKFLLDSSTALVITDSEVHNLIENWPQLSDLSFRTDDHRISPQLTMSVLTSIANL